MVSTHTTVGRVWAGGKLQVPGGSLGLKEGLGKPPNTGCWGGRRAISSMARNEGNKGMVVVTVKLVFSIQINLHR